MTVLEIEPVEPARYTAIRFFADQPWPPGVFKNLKGYPWAGNTQKSWRLADGLWIVYEYDVVLEVLKDDEIFVKYRPKGHTNADHDSHGHATTIDRIPAAERERPGRDPAR